MAIIKSDYVPKITGNVLFLNNVPSVKAADSRGQVILENIEKMLKGQVYQQVTLAYEESNLSWVDAKYKHVLFNLKPELASPVVEEYLNSSSKPKARPTHVANLDYAIATDGGVAIQSNEGNLVNASESKRKTTKTIPDNIAE